MEETQGIRNKGMLITAVVLAVLFAILYNVQVRRIRRSFEREQIEVIKVVRTLKAGETPARADLTVEKVDKEIRESLGNAMLAERMSYATSTPLLQEVVKGQFLLWAHYTGGSEGSLANSITSPEFNAFPLRVDPELSIGEIVRPGDYVDVLGTIAFPPESGQGRSVLRTCRILRAVKVRTVGGTGPKSEDAAGPGPTSRQGGLRRYSGLSVEILREDTPLVMNVLTWLQGQLYVTQLRGDVSRRADKNEVGLSDEELRKLGKRPPRFENKSGAGGADFPLPMPG